MERNYFTTTLLILLSTAVLLLAYPHVHDRVPFLKNNFRAYDFWRHFLQTPPPADTVATSVQDTNTIDNQNVAVLYDGLSTLSNFYRALHQREGQIRIAYYGDSSIEGDLVSQTLRDSLQRRFGGKGVGFVPITTNVSGFRRSVRHRFSPNWFTCKVVTNNYRKLPRGITGEYYTIWRYAPQRDSLQADSTRVDTLPPPVYTGGHWVSYGTTRLNPGTSSFSEARLFYGAVEVDSGEVAKPGLLTATYGKEEQTFSLDGGEAVNEIRITPVNGGRIRFDFKASSALPVFGASLESPQGVIVDNFAARGNSGVLLTNINASVMEQFQDKLDYELVILQFGLNVLNAEMKDYSWYEKEMLRLIRYYQEHLPGVDILVVGVSDKATRIDGKMRTDPSVPRITQAQRQAAEKAGVAFFSMYEAMGGEGAMIKWVEEETPRLANLDYAHFNFEGADKAAQMLLDFLMDGYRQYLSKGAIGQLID